MKTESLDKKSKKPAPIEAKATPVRAGVPTVFTIQKDQIPKLKVGDAIKVIVYGEVSSIRKAAASMEGKESNEFEVELQTPKILEVQANEADVSLRKMIEQI